MVPYGERYSADRRWLEDPSIASLLQDDMPIKSTVPSAGFVPVGFELELAVAADDAERLPAAVAAHERSAESLAPQTRRRAVCRAVRALSFGASHEPTRCRRHGPRRLALAGAAAFVAHPVTPLVHAVGENSCAQSERSQIHEKWSSYVCLGWPGVVDLFFHPIYNRGRRGEGAFSDHFRTLDANTEGTQCHLPGTTQKSRCEAPRRLWI